MLWLVEWSMMALTAPVSRHRAPGPRLVRGLHLPAEAVSVPQHRGHGTRLRRLLHQRHATEATADDAQRPAH